MAILILLLFRHRPENGMFDLLYGGVVLTFLAGFILWDRRYRRRWQNYRSRNWKRIDGRFDEGEVHDEKGTVEIHCWLETSVKV